jgi:hypothetical protein
VAIEMELLIGILGAGIGSGIMAIVQAALQRKWAKQDKRDDRIDALVNAQKVMMIDRVKWLGNQYIRSKQIALSDKDTIVDMHKAYKALGGNGHLDVVMSEVEKLPVVDE